MRRQEKGGFSGGRRRSKKLNLGLGPNDPILYTDIDLLSKCVGAQGQIFSRRRTGLSTKRQRVLKQAIKRARHLALLPYVG